MRLEKKSNTIGPCNDETEALRRLSSEKKVLSVPDWVELVFSNKGLLPWEGGCLWITEDQKPLLQLRKTFEKKERIFGLYSREEIISHELIHAYRFQFNEPIFEEVLAYHTSSSSFRRFLGPLFRSSKESLYFLLASFSFAATFFFTSSLYPFYLLFALYGFFAFRLFKVQRTFNRALAKLGNIFKNRKKALDCLLYLKDAEIIQFSKSSEEEILNWVQESRENSYRQSQLFLFFKP